MPFLPPMRRSTEPERIDAEGQDPVEFAHSLSQVAQVDRLLGAERAVQARLRRAGLDRSVDSVLDIGAGNGEVLSRIVVWLNRRGDPARRARALALDPHPDVIAVGRRSRPGHTWIRADGRHIPLADRSVDLVISVLTLHHLDPGPAVNMLTEMVRVARRAVVVSDLERSRLHWVGARVLGATLWRSNRLTRDDAPASVARAYTLQEMRTLFERAGLPPASVARHVPFRLIGVSDLTRPGGAE